MKTCLALTAYLFVVFSAYSSSLRPEFNINNFTHLTDSGYLDIEKSIQFYGQLGKYCEETDGNISKTCHQMCGKLHGQLKDAYQTYKRDNTQSNQVGAVLMSSMGCESFFSNFKHKSTHYPQVKALITSIRDSKDKWPQPEELILELDDIAEPKVTSTYEVISGLRAKDAVQKLTFEDAQQNLKMFPTFSDLEKNAKSTNHSLVALRESFAKLQQQRSAYEKSTRISQWKDKARQVGEIGAALELYSAINEKCDKNYLIKYQSQTPWLDYKQFPITQVYNRPVSNKRALHYQVSAAFLHRLCFEQLTDNLLSEYKDIQQPEDLKASLKTMMSLPPIISRSNSFSGQPARFMKAADWSPKIQAYISTLEQKQSAAHTLPENSAGNYNSLPVTPPKTPRNGEQNPNLKKTKPPKISRYRCGQGSESNYSDSFYDLKNNCVREFLNAEKIYLAGAAYTVVFTCKYEFDKDKWNRILVHSQAFVQLGFGNRKVDWGYFEGTASDFAVMQAGRKLGESFNCGEESKEFLNKYYDIVMKDENAAQQSTFVKGCFQHYNGKEGFDFNTCKCFAKVASLAIPNIYSLTFKPEIVKDVFSQPNRLLTFNNSCKVYRAL